MKKSIISTLFILMSLSMYSQIHKNTWEATVDGQYGRTKGDYGTGSNYFSTEQLSLGAGASIGYHFSENFMIRLGLDFNHTANNTMNYLTIHLSETTGMQMDLRQEFISVLLPNISFSYSHKIFDRLYYSTCFKTGYGIVHSDDLWVNASGHSDGIKESFHILDFQLSPEFSYLFTNHFGLYLNLNGIEMVADPKFTNPVLNINFNPTYWKLGAKFLLN